MRFEKVLNECKTNGLFLTIDETYVLNLVKPKIVDILHVKQAIRIYFKFLKAQYTEGEVKLKMKYQSIPEEHCELILDQFKIIDKMCDGKMVKIIDENFMGGACGLLNLLMSIRMLYCYEISYYERFKFDFPRQEIDQPIIEPEVPQFVRSFSGVFRPSALNNDCPSQEITKAFSTTLSDYNININVTYTRPEDYEHNSFNSDK